MGNHPWQAHTSPSSTHTQCEACSRSGPVQTAPCLSENKPALSTRHSWKEEFLYGDPGLVPFPTSQPILCISLSPALWGDTARRESAGIGQGNEFLKKNTGAQQYISINCKHKSLCITMKHMLPPYLALIPEFKDNSINHAQKHD